MFINNGTQYSKPCGKLKMTSKVTSLLVDFTENGQKQEKSKAGRESFIYDAAKMWNNASETIKACRTLNVAKSQIRLTA